MSIETLIAENTAALTANTAALREVLTAGLIPPSNVIPIKETPKPAATPAPAKGKTKAATPEPEAPAETPTKVDVAASESDEFADPLDPDTTVVVPASEPAVDPEAVIVQIMDTWKAMQIAADAERKTVLKDKFPELREKWGLAEGAKLTSLKDTPENLVGLLEDIKAL